MATLVHIVDDEAPLREALAFLLSTRGLHTALHASGEAFLSQYKPRTDHA
jgi:two-component system response regulator DctR